MARLAPKKGLIIDAPSIPPKEPNPSPNLRITMSSEPLSAPYTYSSPKSPAA